MIGELVEREAIGAAAALASLNDEAVGLALRRAAELLEERAQEVLASNARDLEAARETLDEGALDRLRLDEPRLATLARQLEATAALEPLEREIASRTLANGLQVRELRIPVGTIGANFEARPGVALDIAAQVLKSLNAIVLRTGGAALGTVETLVDQVLRPALEAEGIDGGAVGLVRSADRVGRRGARLAPALDPARDPARQRRLDRGARAPRGRQRRSHARARRGRRRPLRPRLGTADRVTAIVDASLDRLGVCNRLNLALVDREAAGLAADLVAACEGRGVDVVGTARAAAVVPVGELDEPIGHEWASDPARVATVTLDIVDDLDEAVQIANTETSALAAGIVAEDADAVERFFSLYRGTSAFWHASTRFTDGFELNGTPETGINVDGRRPAGARHLPRPVAAPVPRRRRRHASIDEDRRQARLEPGRDAEGSRAARLARREGEGGGGAARGRPLRLHRLLRCDRARRAPARLRAEAVDDAPAPGRVGRRPGAAPAGLGAGVRARRPPGGADPALAGRRRRPADLRQRLQHASTRCSGSARSRS